MLRSVKEFAARLPPEVQKSGSYCRRFLTVQETYDIITNPGLQLF